MELTRTRVFGKLTTADLLLALLKVGGIAAQVLKELGVDERIVLEAGRQSEPATGAG